MDISGSSREGWMAFVPLAVLVLIVIGVLGGPAAVHEPRQPMVVGHRWLCRQVGQASLITGKLAESHQ